MKKIIAWLWLFKYNPLMLKELLLSKIEQQQREKAQYDFEKEFEEKYPKFSEYAERTNH